VNEVVNFVNFASLCGSSYIFWKCCRNPRRALITRQLQHLSAASFVYSVTVFLVWPSNVPKKMRTDVFCHLSIGFLRLVLVFVGVVHVHITMGLAAAAWRSRAVMMCLGKSVRWCFPVALLTSVPVVWTAEYEYDSEHMLCATHDSVVFAAFYCASFFFIVALYAVSMVAIARDKTPWSVTSRVIRRVSWYVFNFLFTYSMLVWYLMSSTSGPEWLPPLAYLLVNGLGFMNFVTFASSQRLANGSTAHEEMEFSVGFRRVGSVHQFERVLVCDQEPDPDATVGEDNDDPEHDTRSMISVTSTGSTRSAFLGDCPAGEEPALWRDFLGVPKLCADAALPIPFRRREGDDVDGGHWDPALLMVRSDEDAPIRKYDAEPPPPRARVDDLQVGYEVMGGDLW